MKDCYYAEYCFKSPCNKACPVRGESEYLLDRNGLIGNKSVIKAKPSVYEKPIAVIESDKLFATMITDNTIDLANRVTYAGVCKNWYGNQFHCSVYHLKFSTYMDELQKSWSYKEVPEAFEYVQIWISTAKILVISNLDFVNFKDFQAQTLLNLIHTRMSNELKTIVVAPKIESLVGTGPFFDRMKSMMKEAIVK